MHLGHDASRLVSAAARRLLASPDDPPTGDQSALQRARLDTSGGIAGSPVRFTVTTACGIAVGSTLGALFASDLPPAAQVGVAVAAAIVGVFTPVATMLMLSWARAFPRQRDEARIERDLLRRPPDLAGLNDEFEGWVRTRKAARPYYGLRVMDVLFHPENPLAAVYKQQDNDLANYDAATRLEYHQQFRSRAVRLVGADHADPETLADFEKLAAELNQLARDAQTAEAVAEAQGTPVSGEHLVHLQGLRDRVHLDVQNENPPSLAGVGAGESQDRVSFFAHYSTLRDPLEIWEKEIANRDAALEGLALSIPKQIAVSGISDLKFVSNAVADCFAEDILVSIRRREYGVRSLQLRCVADVVGPNPDNIWNAYLHSGRAEHRVAVVRGPGDLSAEGVAEHHQTVVVGLETELQRAYAAIHSSGRTP